MGLNSDKTSKVFCINQSKTRFKTEFQTKVNLSIGLKPDLAF